MAYKETHGTRLKRKEKELTRKGRLGNVFPVINLAT